MKIIRSQLAASDFSNPTIRYDADTDQIQMTPDGGLTWNPAPGSDPRHAPAFLKPPVAGSNKQCDAAANKVKWLHDFIDSAISLLAVGGLILQFTNMLLDYVDILSAGFTDLLSLVISAASGIFSLGHVALEGAFTSTEYDLLLCIFFCHADGNGVVSAAQLADIETAITAQLNTTAAFVTNSLLFLQGEVGLSNAGAIGTQTGDCSACDCGWCLEADLTVIDGGFAAGLPGYGTWVSGTGWEAQFTGILAWQLRVFIDFGSGFAINSIDVTYSVVNADGGTNDLARGYTAAGGTLLWTINGTIGNGGSGTETVHGNPSGSTGFILVGTDATDPGSMTFTHIKLKGTGTPPTLTGWTDCS